jgi:hypothetical protein
MDLFNTIAKSVVETATNAAKVIIHAKPIEANGKVQPVDNNAANKNQNHAIARKVPKSVDTAGGFGF